MSDTTHEAHERIWAFEPDIFDNCSVWQDAPSPAGDAIEYVRADLVKERSDEVQAAVAAERERCAKVADHLENILDALGFLTGGDWELEGWGISQEEGAEIRKDLAAIRKGGE